MTSGFMQGTKDGRPISIAIDQIVCYKPCYHSGTEVYTTRSYNKYDDLHCIRIDQDYETVNTMLQDFINNQRKYILDIIRKEFEPNENSDVL